MSPTPADVETALRLLRAGYPGYNPQIDAETTALWHLALGFTTGPVVIAAASRWVQNEQRFPTLTDFMAEARRAGRHMAQVEIETGQRATAKCLECDGVKMVETDAAGHGTYRPCSRCNPPGFQRWRGGHYVKDHDCEECREMRRTQTKASR